MPAAAVLLAGGGILGAHDLRAAAKFPSRDALVTAAALTDLVEPAFLDLPRQKRVRYRRPGPSDQVELPRRDDLHHRVRVREPAHADDGLVRVVPGLDHSGQRLLVVLGEES